MEMNRSFFSAPVLVFLLLSGTLGAQNKYFIRFKNKSGTPYTIQTAEKFVTKRSIERRARYNIPFTVSDLPVVPAYLEQLQAVHGTQLRYPLKWLNGAVVSFAPGTDSAALAAINQEVAQATPG